MNEQENAPEPPRRLAETSIHGRTCVKCDSPVHYSYTAEVHGYCSRCTDALKKQVLEGHRADLERNLIGTQLPEPGAGRGRFILGFLLGGLTVLLVALAASAFKPDLWEPLVQHLRDLVERLGSR